jgi:hypothetical protein
VCVCVSVCVCERERARERERTFHTNLGGPPPLSEFVGHLDSWIKGCQGM